MNTDDHDVRSDATDAPQTGTPAAIETEQEGVAEICLDEVVEADPPPITPAQRLEFRQQGYVVIESGVPDSILDELTESLSPFWGPDRIDPIGAAIWDYNRIQDYWTVNAHVHALATAPKVLGALRMLYGRQPKPFQTLNFERGTQQPVHSDSIHFNSEPFGLMCGVWIALEDIGPDQGPLVYYPGSQDLPEMNFEQFGLSPSYDAYPDYEVALAEFIAERRLQPAYGLLRRGEALIWAANLLHGGSHQYDKSLTRRSQVTHYYLDGAVPWRPGLSQDERFYYEPRWIPATWTAPPAPETPDEPDSALGEAPGDTEMRGRAALRARIRSGFGTVARRLRR